MIVLWPPAPPHMVHLLLCLLDICKLLWTVHCLPNFPFLSQTNESHPWYLDGLIPADVVPTFVLASEFKYFAVRDGNTQCYPNEMQ
ncbi:uncharacterized protein F5147DRAFT_678745 [Suillus discolor]|uniref:Secreted protein n=1 Tax=Suillus discolor TaxID=1912936 RepID=A0A9P7JXF5_9AGAM|nr:uncharacterized protein F5147DRAFT_678745 [Suillus discolor]KAG2114267.1 hypothetical protein F5147DRAFT_678745 [Suillus discolor]